MGRRNGLSCFDPSNNQLMHYTVLDGLPNNHISSLLLDQQNNLWMGTNNGLSWFNPTTNVFRNFDRHDGAQNEIFLNNSAFQAADNTMLFGGVDGFNVVCPENVQATNPHVPKVLITDLRLANTYIELDKDLLFKAAPNQRLVIPYNYQALNIDLLVLGYTQPGKNRYAYRIAGVDANWNYAKAKQTAAYSGLPFGRELTLEVRAANNDNVWGEVESLVTLYVQPPFWKTIWFRTLAMLFIVLAWLTYYKWRTWNIKRQNKWLAAEVEAKTTEIVQQADTLQVANQDLKQQTAIIQQQVKELDQLYRAQSSFFTGLSHEFRTPLTLLLGHLQELTDKMVLTDPSQRQLLQQMQMSTSQLLELVNQLLDAARLESGRYRLRIAKGDVLEEVNRIAESFRVLTKQKGLEFELCFQNDFSSQHWFDRDVLRKILNNLLLNAIKFTSVGSITIAVKLDHQAKQEQLLVEVKDTGIGIPENKLPFIFDRFYRIEQLHYPVQNSSGVGLSLVRQLVQLHKGTIQVQSNVQEGTTFTLTLPITKHRFTTEEVVHTLEMIPSADNASPFLKAIEREAILPVLPSTEALRVLVVEDHPDIRAYLVRQLQGNYQLLVAEDGQAGWEQAVTELPDLIISDVLMPKMDGFTLCEKLKVDRRTSHIPVILLTALSEQANKMKGLKYGADVYLSKPFSRDELLLRMNNLIGHAEKIKAKFLAEYQLDHVPDGLSDMEQHFLQELTDTIMSQLTNEQLNAEVLAKSVGLSRSHLFRKLKSLTGMSVSEFIRDYRLRKAYQLLCEENNNISEIIHLTGFKSRSSFYSAFKKKFKLSPKEIREEMSEKQPQRTQ
jgi:signal transduction histidine kinase/DNA-binding response OmpR family regulator